jgi:protein tyrosine/serine phosphatase
MQTKFIRYLIFLFITLTIVSAVELRVRPSQWAQPIIGSSLDNLYKVSPGIYRSEQPNSKDFNDVVNLGIGEILSLREYHSDEDEAKAHKVILHRIKIDTSEIDENQIEEALRVIINRKSNILVHCWHGSDRTGAVIAAYRVVVEGWSKEEAIDELQNGDFGYHGTVYPNIVKLIEGLDVKNLRIALLLNKQSIKPTRRKVYKNDTKR